MSALAEREGLSHHEIGSWPSDAAIDPAIGAWAAARGIAGVVWTAQSPSWLGHDRAPEPMEALEFLASLIEAGAADHAVRYVRKTPPQTKSPLRTAIEQSFGWTPI